MVKLFFLTGLEIPAYVVATKVIFLAWTLFATIGPHLVILEFNSRLPRRHLFNSRLPRSHLTPFWTIIAKMCDVVQHSVLIVQQSVLIVLHNQMIIILFKIVHFETFV